MTQKFSIKGFADNSITGEKIAGFTSATDGFVITKSSGSLTWAQAAAANPTMGGDLSGTASNAQLAAGVVGATEIASTIDLSSKTVSLPANSISVTELNVTAGTTGQALTIDGGGALGFTTIVTDPTMGGDMTGTASNAQIAADAVGSTEIAAGAVTSNELATTGTATSSTFLAGNMAWKIVPGPEITTPNNFFKNWSDINSSFTTTVSASENAGVVGPISIVTGNTWSIGGGTVKIL